MRRYLVMRLPGARAARRVRRDQRGLTLIEVIVAVALLAIIITPIARLVIQTGGSTNDDRLRVEATNVAITQLEKLQNLARFGDVNSSTTTQNLGTVSVDEACDPPAPCTVDTFSVTASWHLQPDSPTAGATLCTDTSGTPAPPQIYRVSVTVTWPVNTSPKDSVKESTFIAPEAGGSIPETSGELAVPIDNDLGQPFTAVAVPVTVTGSWAGGGTADPVPSGEYISESETDTSDTGGGSGCAIFPQLDPDPGYQYTVTIENPDTSTFTGAVTYTDYSGVVNGITATAGPYVIASAVTLRYGSVVVTPAIDMDLGTTTQVSFFTQGYSSGAGEISPAADLPLTVQEVPELTGPNNTFSFDGLNVGTTGVSISSIQLYPYSAYLCWSGDTLDSAPTYYTGGPAPVGVDATMASPSLSLPVYPIVIKPTGVTSGYTFIATENLSPQHAINLNALTTGATPESSSGIPLGQYKLTTSTGAAVSPAWFWVTPSGVYQEAAGTGPASTVPTGTPTATGNSPITVSVA
jgi:prepilin-type N-terminal cleavage/methylation domain-containing protein